VAETATAAKGASSTQTKAPEPVKQPQADSRQDKVDVSSSKKEEPKQIDAAYTNEDLGYEPAEPPEDTVCTSSSW
jgi:hypothetical protein